MLRITLFILAITISLPMAAHAISADGFSCGGYELRLSRVGEPKPPKPPPPRPKGSQEPVIVYPQG
jgi:hypothetical protein